MIKDFQNIPILITGIERSGSSIIARIIEHCGAFSGRTTPMQENESIKGLIDNLYVKEFGIPSNAQYPLPNVNNLPFIDLKEKVKIALGLDKYDGMKPWMYKSSRIGQIYPIWEDNYPNAKYIIVRRRTGDIVNSCSKTGYMSAFKKETVQASIGVKDAQEGWLWWVHKHEELFGLMTTSQLHCKVIWPERMAYGDFSQIKELLAWVGLSWKDSIVDLVKPLLKNSLQKERSL